MIRELIFANIVTIFTLGMQAASFAILLVPLEQIAAPIPDDEPYIRVWGKNRVTVVMTYVREKARNDTDMLGCFLPGQGKEGIPSVFVPLDLYDEVEPRLEKLKDGVRPLKEK